MAKIGVAREQGMISRILGMVKEILVDSTNENDESVLAEVENIRKQENSSRVKFLMGIDSEIQNNSKQVQPVEKIQTTKVVLEDQSKNKDAGREPGDE